MVVVVVLLLQLVEALVPCMHAAALACVAPSEACPGVIKLDLLFAHDQRLVPLRCASGEIYVVVFAVGDRGGEGKMAQYSVSTPGYRRVRRAGQDEVLQTRRWTQRATYPPVASYSSLKRARAIASSSLRAQHDRHCD